jgi:catechol 2,3-dioxygenase-like lactoylglutathione lyase family enzyme
VVLLELRRRASPLIPVRSGDGTCSTRSSGTGVCHHPVVGMTMRFEIFPDDLDVIVDFYTRILLFRLTADQRDEPDPYVSLQRDDVRIGAARRAVPGAGAARRPPAGVELVLEADDVIAERERVIAAGWPVAEDLKDRPWGLTDFRVLDPAGYYLRITNRAG